MKFEVDTDTILQIVADKMVSNLVDNAKAQGLDEEEVQATIILNRKKITKDAQNLAAFFVGLYVTSPAENPAAEVVQEELPVE